MACSGCTLARARRSLAFPVGVHVHDPRQLFERQFRHLGDVAAREGDRQGFVAKPLAVAARAVRAHEKPRDALLHQRAFGVREGLQHVAARAAERAHVARLLFPLQGSPHLVRGKPGVDRHDRLFVGEQQPVSVLFGQLAPRPVDVVAERRDDVAKILSVPGRRPCRDRALTNRA